MKESNEYCPLVGIGEVKMTENGFASACLAQQFQKNLFDPCPNCKKGKRIQAGKKVKPPKGMTFFTPIGWAPSPIIQPIKQHPLSWGGGRKAIYPFTNMEIGTVYKGLAAYKNKIRTAASSISRKHGKKFINWIEGDKIIVKRIE